MPDISCNLAHAAVVRRVDSPLFAHSTLLKSREFNHCILICLNYDLPANINHLAHSEGDAQLQTPYGKRIYPGASRLPTNSIQLLEDPRERLLNIKAKFCPASQISQTFETDLDRSLT